MDKFFVQQENGTILNLFDFSTLCVRKQSNYESDNTHEVVAYKLGDTIPLVLGVFQTKCAAQWAIDQIMILLEKHDVGFSFSFCQSRMPYEYNIIKNEEE